MQATMKCKANSAIKRALEKKTFEVGILIGQQYTKATDDLLYTTIATPNENDEQQGSKIQDVSGDWIAEHASHVKSILPGGLDVVGLYVVSKDDPKTALKLCQYPTIPLLSKENGQSGGSGYLVHLHSATKKVTCWKFVQNKTTMMNVTWSDVALKRYEGLMRVDLCIGLQGKRFENVDSIRRDVDFVRQVVQEHINQLKHAVGRVSNAHAETPRVHIYTHPEEASSISVQRVYGSFKLAGDLFCTAFVAADEPHGSDIAIEAIKDDYARTLRARIELLIEEWEQILEEAALQGDESRRLLGDLTLISGNTIQLPRRCLFNWQGVKMSSYVLEGDDCLQSIENTKEIIGVEAQEMTDMEFHVAEKIKTIPKAKENKTKSVSSSASSQQDSRILILGALLVLLAAIIASFLVR